MDETRLYKSRPKLLGQILASAVLAVLCPLLTAGAVDRPITLYLAGWGGAVLFAIGTAMLIRDFQRHEPMLVLDAQGVSGPGLETMRFVPWSAIDSVAISDRRRRGVVISIDEARLGEADRTRMGLKKAVHDKRGHLLAQIRVADLTIKAEPLAELLSRGARTAEQRG